MKYSGIGGQAVMEGVMMKNQDRYAVAVRKSDNEIAVEVHDFKGVTKSPALRNMPFVRGVVNFIESLVLGMNSLMESASYFEDEEDGADAAKDNKDDNKKEKDEKNEKAMMGGVVFISVILAVFIFMVLPYGASLLFEKYIHSRFAIAAIEGALRLIIFIGYIAGISLMDDIKRVYMYHGAEHKCINCIEHGMELTVENVRKSSKEHKRCGTSFLIFVMLISIILFMFINVDSRILRLVARLALVPVIAGISYEFIRLAGRSDNVIVNIISKPGLWMQKITTREPDDEMIEVGIASVEAVFDWKKYLEENR